MKKMLVVPLLSAVTLAVLGVAGASPALAAIPCPASAPPGTVLDGSVSVEAASPCSLNNVKILGNLIVGPGAFASVSNSDIALKVTVAQGGRLVLNHTSVGIDIVATNSQSIELYSVRVGKSVRSQGSTAGTLAVCGSVINSNLVDTGVSSSDTPNRIGDGAVGCKGNKIGGQLILSNNAAQGIIKGNTVNAIKVTDNSSTTPYVIARNTISQALDCSGNAVAPIGGDNVAASKTGQCAGL